MLKLSSKVAVVDLSTSFHGLVFWLRSECYVGTTARIRFSGRLGTTRSFADYFYALGKTRSK